MKNGPPQRAVIAPTGTTLQSGMRVRIWGSWNGDGTFEANQIDVLPDGATVRRYPNDPYGTGAYGPGPNRYDPNYNPNSPYQGPNYNPNSSYQGYMTGYVSSFQPYNLWLGRGAAIRPLQSGHHHQQRRFARARWAEQADRLATAYIEVDGSQDMDAGGLLGPSGSGKSTLLMVICLF